MRFSNKTKELLEKAKESCLLAVDIYNKPRTSFRSGAYVVLMAIAYTSLFHAIFEKNKIKYYYREKGGRRYKKVDGDYKAWELKECVKEYFKDKAGDYIPIQKNIEFFIPLRHKIEHRFMPELDSEIFGECQAALHNFEYLLENEFGSKHRIQEDLLFSLQFAQNYNKSEGKKKKKNAELDKIKAHIVAYREGLGDEIYSSQKYSFKIYLLPKLINNKNKADYAIEWINYDPTRPEDMEKYTQLLGFIKERIRPVSNVRLLKPGKVAERVRNELAKIYGSKIKFNAYSHHAVCYKKYGVRPGKEERPEKTKEEFCIYDDPHKDYVYTERWVEFLIKELSDKKIFFKLFPKQKEYIEGKS